MKSAIVPMNLKTSQVKQIAIATSAHQKSKLSPKPILYDMFLHDPKVEELVTEHYINGNVTGHRIGDMARFGEKLREHDKSSGRNRLNAFPVEQYSHVAFGLIMKDVLRNKGIGFDRKTGKVIGVSTFAVIPESMTAEDLTTQEE